MIVVMKSDSPSAEIERLSQELRPWDITFVSVRTKA